jgi:hypothetical protein
MLKLLKNKKGQGMTVQYAMSFFFVVAVVVGMTMYFKRTLQARIRDAAFYMGRTVHNVYDQNMAYQYEPYYLLSSSDRISDSGMIHELLPSFNSDMGIFVDTEAASTVISTFSNQLPPALAE